ncbi:MAG: hypothetical protein AB7O49_18715 [Sphingomonadales bacterium]
MQLLGLHGMLRQGKILALILLALAGAAIAEPYRDEFNTGGGGWQPGEPLYEGAGTERDHFGTQGRSTGQEKCTANVIAVDRIGGKSWYPGCYAIRGDNRHACCGCISSPDDPYSVQEFNAEGLPVCGDMEQPEGAKDIYRESNDPRYPGRAGHVGIERLAEAIDDCMDKSIQRGWGLWDPPSLVEYSEGVAYYEPGSVYYNPARLGSMTLQKQVYALARAYAGHAIHLRDRYLKHGEPGMYEASRPQDTDTDLVTGFITRCLMQKKLLDMPLNKAPDDPRLTYGAEVRQHPRRLEAFDAGFTRWPLSPLYRPKLDPAHR